MEFCSINVPSVIPVIFKVGLILSTMLIEIDLDSESPSTLIISNVTEYSPGESHFAFAFGPSIIPMPSIFQLILSI